MDARQPAERAPDPEGLDRRHARRGARSVSALEQMTAGAATPAQMGAFLMALRVRGETVEEITGAAQMLRSRMNRVEVPAGRRRHRRHRRRRPRHLQRLDLRGAGCGRRRRQGRQARQPRASPRMSGASDVLAALGVKLDVPPAVISRCVAEAGVGFMWAPMHHPAMKHWAPIRGRARHPHHLQPARADLATRPACSARWSACSPAVGRADRARAEESRRASTSGSCTATTASMS